ncbi:TetR family transcriptional regulator [Mycobacterium nebraskense]|uniref:TetR family transcriptional regulator n=1 Tax=Mycobacterium nebraskense TaxID=244292 RepID=A0A1X2A260_9MYCO|nr:TetR/AcrR family transcriptional regulator [Mycobacterium nebraskense]KKC03425.1 TetR family transcriptional regulator [Mycobacterium nebraskense]MBI2696035.1 TetR/AcrR family transcriptional regulator [Mycobacterium nebraskense]MCV7116456.1 TetR/AcrR family transcriptional regulator [Mycobacterium nebraskense]ORW34770.1 TetR family transcriptional regulator [Mycobacterium nebraskense]
MLTAVSKPEEPAGPAVTAGDARQRILQTTIQCFCAYGYEKSSMKLISTKAGVSQTLLHYHFETKEKLFQAAIDDMAKRMFATAATQLPHRVSVREGLTEAAGLMYALFIDNLDAVTFMVEFAAAANHNEFLRIAYVDYRDTQRRQLAEALRRIAGNDAPQRLIDESVRLFETVLLGMSMQRPFVSDTSGFRRDYDVFAQMLAAHITEGLEPRR